MEGGRGHARLRLRCPPHRGVVAQHVALEAAHGDHDLVQQLLRCAWLPEHNGVRGARIEPDPKRAQCRLQ
jgi:hypothetical protein